MAKKLMKLHVRVKPSKLEGLPVVPGDDTAKMKLVMIEVKWKGPVTGFVPFYRPNRIRNSTSQKPVRDCHVEWDEEFEHVCCLVGPWDLSFNVLYGESVESKSKWVVIGKVSLDLAELALKMESTVERKLPIQLKGSGISKEATLVVSVSLAEVRNNPEWPSPGQSAAESDSLLKMVKSLRGSRKKAKGQDEPTGSKESAAASHPSQSPGTDSASGEMSPVSELGSSSSPETGSIPVHKTGIFSWKKRRLSLSGSRKSLVQNTDEHVDRPKDDEIEVSVEPNKQEESSGHSNDWVLKELVSRDGNSKLKSKVFLASFDQRSEEAAGESACTAVVAVTAHWLHTNPRLTPSRPEFDTLITQGSSLWQKLCTDQSYTDAFPDKHFDLETILSANIRPIRVCPKKSFTAFFSPEKFESLKGLMSFDQMWDEIEKNFGEGESTIYIVSWNDHFFVIKADVDGYYIIDSLGERLHEGCKQAYILKFDDSSLLIEKRKVEVRWEEKKEEKNPNSEQEETEEEVIICRGKECCREYIKRFLAAITVAQLEAEEEKVATSIVSLHRRLQIDLHYTSVSISADSLTS